MKKIITLLTLVLIVGFVLGQKPGIVIGQITDDDPAVTNQEIKNLNNDIDQKKNDIKNLQKRQEQYTVAINETQQQKASLNNQLAILDNRLAKAELDISLVQTQIDQTDLEIQKTDIEIANKNDEINTVMGDIENVLRLLYKKDNVTSLEVMLLNNSFSDFLGEIKYLEDVNENIGNNLDSLKKLKAQLEKEKQGLSDQEKEMADLKKQLEDSKTELASEQNTKLLVLSQVNQSERQYQRLLEQAKKEQDNAAAEIASMEKLVRAKLAKLEGGEPTLDDNGLVWPVPKNVITAYFHDPDYPFRYIFEHPAVDIKAGQATPIKAAASGYVAQAKNGGMGYSYIMLIHGDGLSTVYGHVSKIYVQNDDYVVQGQTIGLSGGMPGTPGAGSLTTGPHLHFEVRLNGIPVDPLSYLP